MNSYSMSGVRVFLLYKNDFRTITASRRYCSNKFSLAEAYEKLGIKNTKCTDEDVKNAYIKQVKSYHPDVKGHDSDAAKFRESKEAYAKIMSSRKSQNDSCTVLDDVEFDFDNKHAAPQHRRYLSFEGIGSGNPSRRQKQYQQAKVMLAANRVNQYRLDKLMSESNLSAEVTVLKKDIKASKRIKTTNLIDRLVEDLIQEAMSKGEFQNLRGSGKPLPPKEHMYNPYIDSSTLNINRVLIENGYMPEWVSQEKNIRADFEKAVMNLETFRKQIGNYPFSNQSESRKWESAVVSFRGKIKDINKRIDTYNLVTPALFQQKVHYKTDPVICRIANDNGLAYTWKAEMDRNISTEYEAYTMKSAKLSFDFDVFREFMKELLNIFKHLKLSKE